MKVIEQGGDYTKKEIYELTKSPKIENLKDHAGDVIKVEKYLIYEDVNGRDKTATITLISIHGDGRTLVSNSATVIESFHEILDIMDGEPFSVEILEGTSKAGRTFYSVALA